MCGPDYGRLSQRYKAFLELIGHVERLLPISGLLFLSSLPYVASIWPYPERGSGHIGGIPAFFLLKTIIPAITRLLFLQGFAEYHRRIRAWQAG